MPYPRPKGQGGESLEGVGHNRSRKSTTFFPTGKILLLTASDFFGAYSPDEADFTDLAGGQDLEVLGAGVSCGGLIRECDAVMKMHYFAVAFPKGKVYGVARM